MANLSNNEICILIEDWRNILSKKVKPLIILQANDTLKSEEMQQLANTATKAFVDGCLIIDKRVNVIAFDDRGRLVYPISENKVNVE